MILIIDNYDSFTFNLYQLIGEINSDIKVVRNDKLTIEDIRAMQPDHIIISPGPGNPKQAGICLDVIRQIVHGKADKVYLEAASPIFKDMPDGFEAARYHSLIVEPESLPECLEVTAKTAKNEIMALQHKTLPVYGVQFHPESIMTPQGRTILKNFLSL